MPTTACRAVGGAGAAAQVRPADLVRQPLQGAASSGAGRGHTAQPVRLPARNRWDPDQGVPARPTRHGYLALPRLQPGRSGSRARRRTPAIQRPPSTAPQPRMVSTCRPRQSPTARRPGTGQRGCRCSRRWSGETPSALAVPVIDSGPFHRMSPSGPMSMNLWITAIMTDTQAEVAVARGRSARPSRNSEPEGPPDDLPAQRATSRIRKADLPCRRPISRIRSSAPDDPVS